MIPLVPSIFLHVIFIFFALVNGEQETIYDILKAHGLPTGLLPKGITRFEFDETGRFEVKGIWVDVPSSGVIYFDVGVVSKQFSLSWFETPRDCMAIQDDSESGDSIGDGKLLAEAVAKSPRAKHRYELDHGGFGRNEI
ncbi:hypothetical protein V6Z11_A07G229600 [Gossypium hirsutum]